MTGTVSRLPYEWLLARRSLGGGGFLSFISSVALGGIALGVLVGSIPFHFPNMPAAVQLGLAGGPLLIAIILSRMGRIGPLIYYMPLSANFMVRELGITLFLACVGLKAGDQVITAGGVHGKVVSVQDKVVTLEIAEKVRIKVARSSIAGVIKGQISG